jgi:hypothetical protein
MIDTTVSEGLQFCFNGVDCAVCLMRTQLEVLPHARTQNTMHFKKDITAFELHFTLPAVVLVI